MERLKYYISSSNVSLCDCVRKRKHDTLTVLTGKKSKIDGLFRLMFVGVSSQLPSDQSGSSRRIAKVDEEAPVADDPFYAEI